MYPRLFSENKPEKEDQQIDHKCKKEMVRKVEILAVVDKDEDQTSAAEDIQQTDQRNAAKDKLPLPGGRGGETKDESNV